MHGIVYKFSMKNNATSKQYIGSTKMILSKRRGKHKHNCNHESAKEYNIPIYQYIRDNGGWDNFEMSIIEERDDFIDEEDLCKRELHYINELPADKKLNVRKPYLSLEERQTYKSNYDAGWRGRNTDYMRIYCKKWRENKKKVEN
jgi:hypothetical protein